MKQRSFPISILLTMLLAGCSSLRVKDLEIGRGWAKNSVNTVIFRKNAITSSGNMQFVSYYNDSGKVVVASRELRENDWKIKPTSFTGNTNDAHNAISIALDGEGKIHASWDHHDNPLNYAVSRSSFSPDLQVRPTMTGSDEQAVSYPQFFNLKNGNLLFLYRSGKSGKGRLVSKLYETSQGTWKDLNTNLIDGQGERNPYWQAFVDDLGTIHVSWVWRENWDVASNHDVCYAKSTDGGVSWQRSTGEKYTLPITAKTAEYAWRIPQNSSLINQTSMVADKKGRPYIVTYWTENSKTDYQVIYLEDGQWKHENTNFRRSEFQLGGGGTKRIPISRPQIFLKEERDKYPTLYILFRDMERGNRISVAYHRLHDDGQWEIIDLTDQPVGEWEPNYDINLWQRKQKLHVFVQEVTQMDAEGVTQAKPTPVRVLEVSNLPLK